MTDDEQGRQKKRRRLWLALVALVVLLAVVLVPPLVSVSRYKSRITSLMAASLGRPVRLSSVELRLLPWPGFVLDDLTVDEDPAFGSEPVLHASTVTASIRLLSLWRGRLEISEVSVDDASLNLVRTPQGRWNLDPLLRTAATKAGSASQGSGRPAVPFPYLEATNSRVNFKYGVEKLPFSLVDTDLSFWQEKPGDWRIRLRGQPARTDVSMDPGDTGIVELEASAQAAHELRLMPIHLDLEWRDAQLGQLTRLVTGSDDGWRGDLRGEVHLDGTANAAQITTRLRATRVHRAEFAPVSPMDFDANCRLVYHLAERAVEGLVCDSPLGDGHVRLAGELPGNGGQPDFSVELDRVPVAAGLDALRTVRSGLDPDLEAGGTVSGKVTYAATAAVGNAQKKPAKVGRVRAAAAAQNAQPAGPLSGSFTVEGLVLSGGALSHPMQASKMVLAPAPGPPALAGTVTVPAGGTVPLTLNVRLGQNGYQVIARGQASIARGRELGRAAGFKRAAVLDSLAGDPLTVDLRAEGPWLPLDAAPFAAIAPGQGVPVATAPVTNRPAPAKLIADDAGNPLADSLTGTVTLHNANWKADYLASHVQIAEATLHLDSGATRWDTVAFSYGPLTGTASLTLPEDCADAAPCPVRFEVQFGDLDAATVQAAILGAHQKSTLLSDLIDRIHPSSLPAWPQLEGTLTADSLILGPVVLQDAEVQLHTVPAGVEITSLDATLLGGSVHGAGTVTTGDKPAYAMTADFEKLNPAALGHLLGQRWSGGTLNADGKIDFSGYTGADLTGSAKGTLHFEWRHGSIAAASGTAAAGLSHFDRWTADTVIANGKIGLGQNEMVQGSRKRGVEAVVILREPLKVNFAAPRQAQAKNR
jgi:uncharacterized protein involved in outer membrane biogenesis